MSTGSTAGAASLVLAACLVGISSGVAAHADDTPSAALELRVVTHAALGATDLHVAAEGARRALASAGVQAVWRECDPTLVDCARASFASPFVLIHLLPIAKKSAPATAGDVAWDATTPLPAVLIYVSRSRDLALSIRRGSLRHVHPQLASLATGHLVGLAITHEVGHALGLRHTASGVMRAQPDVAEIVASREFRLAFLPEEAAHMRRSIGALSLRASPARGAHVPRRSGYRAPCRRS